MEKAFETWTHKGTRYLAVPGAGPDGRYSHIVDENGGNYGAWFSVDRFRNVQAGRGGIDDPSSAPIAGSLVALRVACVASALVGT